MKRLVCLALVCVLVSPSVYASGPIMKSAKALAAQQPATERPPRRNPALYWSGVALAAVGVGIFGWGVASKHIITCDALSGIVSCTEPGGHQGALIGIGSAAMSTGVAMSALGGKRVSVAPSARGIGAVGTITF